jgi:hypothetical protein
MTDKIQAENYPILQGQGFFNSGVTRASFISSGNTPVERERLTNLNSEGARTGSSFFSRKVGIGSRGDD